MENGIWENGESENPSKIPVANKGVDVGLNVL